MFDVCSCLNDGSFYGTLQWSSSIMNPLNNECWIVEYLTFLVCAFCDLFPHNLIDCSLSFALERILFFLLARWIASFTEFLADNCSLLVSLVTVPWRASGLLWRAFGIPWQAQETLLDSRGPKRRRRGPEAHQSTRQFSTMTLKFRKLSSIFCWDLSKGTINTKSNAPINFS